MTLPRRDFLRLATLGCACCFAGRGVIAGSDHPAGAQGKAHWSYAGNTGPGHWGELQPDFKVCQLGLEQTPIDLTANIMARPSVPKSSPMSTTSPSSAAVVRPRRWRGRRR